MLADVPEQAESVQQERPADLDEFFKQSGLRQDFVAEKLGISPGHLSNIRKRTRQASLELAVRIADFTGVPLEALPIAKSQGARRVSRRLSHHAARAPEAIPSPAQLEQALFTDGARATEVQPKTMNAQAGARYTGIPYRTLIELARAGHLAYVKTPGVRRWRFKVADLDAALERWTHRTNPEPTFAGLSVERELELIEESLRVVNRSVR